MNRPLIPSLHDAQDIPEENDHLDDVDRHILRERLRAWALRRWPRVGDFILVSGQLLRIAYRWNDHSFQPTAPGTHGSFHLKTEALTSYSGALGDLFSVNQIQDTGEYRPGQFWFFHHDYPAAHNDVTVWAPCRVLSIQED